MKTRIKNQATKYLLNNWHRYDALGDQLDLVNRTNMKNLYLGLSKLTEEERRFLADKYHHKSGRKTDREISKLHDIPERDYQKKRKAIETKLNGVIEPLTDKLHEETGFAPYAEKPRVSRDRGRKDIITGLPYLEMDWEKRIYN